MLDGDLRRDRNFRFLWADSTRGALQVFLRQPGLLVKNDAIPGDEEVENGVWINADPMPGCVVCNIGEMWETWTNGLYKSTLHRVVHRGANYRVSIPFFYEPNFAAVVKPLQAALRLQQNSGRHHFDSKSNKEEIKRTYDPIVYGEFLLSKVNNNFYTEGEARPGPPPS